MIGFLSLLTACKKDVVVETIDLIEPSSVSLVTEPVSMGVINNIELYEAYVIPYTEELSFIRSGHFLSYLVNIGDEVKKGDIIAALDDEPFLQQIESMKQGITLLEEQYKQNLDKLEGDLSLYQIRIDSLKSEKSKADDTRLIDEQLITTDIELQMTKENIKVTKELYQIEHKRMNRDLDKAILSSNKNNIIAPFDGKVVALANLREGDWVNESDPIIGYIDPNDTRVTCEYITETDINASMDYYMYKDGKKYDVTYLPYDKDEYAALILRQETPVSTFHFKGTDADIKQGDYVLICVEKNKKENVLTIPIDTLFKDTNGEYVYLDENGIKLKRYIITGLADTISVEVKEGLKEGDRVYAEN